MSERTRERTVTHTRYGIIYSPCPPRARRYSRDLLVRATSALLNTYLTEKSWVVPHMLQLDIYFKSRKGCILVWWSCAMLVMLYSMIEEHQSCLMHHSAWKKMPTVQRYNPLNQLIDLLTYWLIDLLTYLQLTFAFLLSKPHIMHIQSFTPSSVKERRQRSCRAADGSRGARKFPSSPRILYLFM